MKNGTLVTLVGISGSGKSTTLKTLKDKHDFFEIVQYTNRPMREKEIDGVDYHFDSLAKFAEDSNFIVKEYPTVFGKWVYGINKSELLNSLKSSSKTQILVTDLDSALSIKRFLSIFGYENHIIFLNPEIEEVLYRLEKRGDNIDEVQRRLIADYKDFQHAHKFIDLEVTFLQKKNVISKIENFLRKEGILN